MLRNITVHVLLGQKKGPQLFYVEYHGMLYVSGMFVHVSSLS